MVKNRVFCALFVSSVFVLASCTQNIEPPNLNRYRNPSDKDLQDKRAQLCSQVHIVSGHGIDNQTRRSLFACLNYDGSLDAFAPLVQDDELFESLNSVVSNNNSAVFDNVVSGLDADQMVGLLPFMAKILEHEVIPNMVPVISNVINKLNEEDVLEPMLPSLLTMLQGDYFELMTRSSASAISSGALGKLMKRTSAWLLVPRGDTVLYKELIKFIQKMFRERAEITPVLPLMTDLIWSQAFYRLMQEPSPADSEREPGALRYLLTHELDPIVTLLDTLHLLNRHNNRFLGNIVESVRQHEGSILGEITEGLRSDLSSQLQSELTDWVSADMRNTLFRDSWDRIAKVEDTLGTIFCYFGSESELNNGNCPRTFRGFLDANVTRLLFEITKTNELGKNGDFIQNLKAGIYWRFETEEFYFGEKFSAYFDPVLKTNAPVGDVVSEFINGFSAINLEENWTLNDALQEAWVETFKKHYPVDVSLVSLWNQVMDKIFYKEFNSNINLAESLIYLLGKPSDPNEDGLFDIIFKEFKLASRLGENERKLIIENFLAPLRVNPYDPNSPLLWSEEDLNFLDSIMASLPAVEVFFNSGINRDGNLLQVLRARSSETFPLIKRFVAFIEFVREEEFIQMFRPLLIEAIDQGVIEAVMNVDQGCRYPTELQDICYRKRMGSVYELADLLRPQTGRDYSTALINNLIMFIKSVFDPAALPVTAEFMRVTAEAVSEVDQEELDRFLIALDTLFDAEAEAENRLDRPLGDMIRELALMIQREDFQRLVAALDRINREGNLQPMLGFFAQQIRNGNAEKLIRFVLRIAQQMN